MNHRPFISLCLLVSLLLLSPGLRAEPAAEKTISFGVIGMAGGAVDALASCEQELNVRVTHLKSAKFTMETLPDLSGFDALITSFASGTLKDQYRASIAQALKKNPDMKVFCVGPGPICAAWTDWVGKNNITTDPTMAGYYGLSRESMKDMLRYALVTYFGRKGTVPPPATDKLVTIHHPAWGDPDTIAAFLQRARKEGWDTDTAPRVALGSWRHHVLFHQPKVIDALIDEFARQGILAVCLVADDPKFKERMLAFKPDAVIMTSHTRETVDFWKKLGVPRIHALWFTTEAMDQWRTSDNTGMQKSALFHQIASAEVKGSTECLTAGGTESGGDGGEEILPIPDRIRRIAARTKAWIDLARKKNSEKKLAIITWDREADKAGLMSGPAHNLNAPRSMIAFLNRLKKEGYTLDNLPTDDTELLARLVDHGRQMGSWEPGPLEKLATSGKAVLVPEDSYRLWFEENVPQWRREQVIKQWGPIPGSIMVWNHNGKRFLVLPRLNLGNAIIMTQPLKGETITASMKVQDPDESLLPPTHHFLATYFWLQKEFHPDALVHFGSHGSEWLFPGKMAVLSRADWSDMMIGNLPNINPWLASNTTELLPCKRRARAVTIDFLPPPLMEAGLPDDLLNLESTITKFEALAPGALRNKFLQSITDQTRTTKLDRDLNIALRPEALLQDADIARISQYLHDLGNEHVPASMHILGELPAEDQLIPYLVYAMGKRYLKASKALFSKNGTDADDEFLKKKGRDILTLMLHQKLSATDAVKASGGTLSGDKLPQAVEESLAMATGMYAGLQRTPQEMNNIIAALQGKYIPSGPSGNPERNPGVVPTGRNMFVLNPEELPTRASWELASKLMREYLDNERHVKGRYPQKIAFSLVPFATYSDFGIVESQILYLMGVRPVWDAKNRVRDIELIPAGELGRPRIDVFLSARSIYRDELPSLMKLLDKAIRLAASQKEKDNYVYQHSEAIRRKLEKQGIPADKALALSRARMYGAEPNEILDSHNWFFYLTERSGEWENREDLLEVYLQNSKHVYTEGVWGEMSPEAFDEAIAGTETILRSWYDNRDFVLSNKFTWWVDGTLSLAIKHITGKEPEYLFVDVRDTDEASIVDSTAVVQKDFRSRVTNPRWIEGMMKEGYAGGNIMAKNIDNLMGWEIMRENSVDDSNWNDLADVYVRDSRHLQLPQWFDSTNPHAFQKVAVTMLETARKGFWKADEKTRLEIAAAYAASVARHGRAGGPREGGNDKLETFVEDTLAAADTPEMNALLKQYQQKSAELKAPVDTQDPGKEPVAGNRLEKTTKQPEAKTFLQEYRNIAILIACALLIIAAGFFGRGAGLRKRNKHHD